MNPEINEEFVKSRCEILEALGFVKYHSFPCQTYVVNPNRDASVSKVILVDFSAIDEKYFIQHAINEAYKQGNEAGQKELRSRIQKLFGI